MIIDFKEVSRAGLESAPLAATLADLRTNEARYFWNKFKLPFETVPASQEPDLMADIEALLKRERDLVFTAKPLEVSKMLIEERIVWIHVFYEDGLAINVLYELDNPKKRAVGLKLSDGMDIPSELVDKFKFARQKSTLAGTIRGSYFTLKGDNQALIDKWVQQIEEKK